MAPHDDPLHASPSSAQSDTNPSRRSVLQSGAAIAGATVLAGCGSVLGRDETPTASSEGERLPFTYSAGGPGCHDDVDESTTGWLHTVAHGEGYDVTFDAILAHDATNEPRVSLVETGMGGFDLRFERTGADDAAKTPRESECLFGSHVTGAGVVPAGFDELRVVAGDETLRRVQRESTTPELVRLPTPVEL